MGTRSSRDQTFSLLTLACGCVLKGAKADAVSNDPQEA